MSNYIASDTDLVSIANAIRTKGGTSASLSFPTDFVSAINALNVASGSTLADYLSNSITGMLHVPGCTKIAKSYAFRSVAATSIYLPDVTQWNANNQSVYSATSLVKFSAPKVSSHYSNTSNTFQSCSNLEEADIGKWPRIGSSEFSGCTKLGVLVLRKTTICTLGNVNAFTSTKFANGGAGGKIYIPKSLYDHLGDNSSSDYRHATNWSTVYGYGTITFEKIEGSIYESEDWILN